MDPDPLFRIAEFNPLPDAILADKAGEFSAGQIVYLRLRVDGGMRDHDGVQCAACSCVDRKGRVIDGEEAARQYVVPVRYVVAAKIVAEEMQ
jgi:hypothetical protein